MDHLKAITLLTFLSFVHGIDGQTVSVSGDPVAEVGINVSLTCTVNGGTANVISWFDESKSSSVQIYSGSNRFSVNAKYDNFKITSLSTDESIMTIELAEVEDDGDYRCTIPTDEIGFETNLVIEAPGTLTGPTLNSIINNNEDMYEATCDVVGSKPQVNITWFLNGVKQTDGNGKRIVPSNPTQPSNPPLSNTKSVFKFPATQENYGWTLICLATGYQLSDIDLQKSIVLDIHSSPSNASTTVTADYVTDGTDIRVTCTAENEPAPTMRNYYIFSNGTQIHESMESVTEVTVSNPVTGTNYTCMAGNYLGNTSISEPVTYDPTRPTTPTTAPNTTQPNAADGGSTEPGSATGLSAGEIAGIVVGAIIFIAIIIVLIVVFVVKPDCIGGSGSPNTTTTHKHSTSAVGSSNGNEKEKIRPEAAPRGHSSIKHTTDNPQQAEYAMVDRKPGGRGDSTDARGNGAGQNEQPGMHYADLDLTPSAGHSDRVVPKNEDGVVVYSSILV